MSNQSFHKYIDSLTKLSEFYDCLEDEESKILFDARFEYYLNHNKEKFLQSIETMQYKFTHDDLQQYLLNFPEGTGIWIFGAGLDGKKTFHILKSMNQNVMGFIDNNRNIIGQLCCNLKIIDIDELNEKFKNCIVIISSAKYASNIYSQLLSYGYPRNNIYYPIGGHLIAMTGNQYFEDDFLKPFKNEIFLDCGCYDGMTTLAFTNWCNNDYNKIYAFEPDILCVNRCKKLFECKKIQRVSLFNMALYDKKSLTYYENNGMASGQISLQKTEHKVSTISIDDVLKGEAATFIKLDVEGSELKTLQGALKTLKKYKPKLAISIYHKPEDILEIPLYLMTLNLDYKFYIRHYTSYLWETVLYAI